MAWLRLDDGFTKHPKFSGWTPAEKWAWLEVMEYCARYGTGGRIPDDLSLMPRTTTEKLLAKALLSGWLDVSEDGSRSIHDWSIYNPKDPTAALRQARSRARKGSDGHASVTQASRESHGSERDENRDSRAGTRAYPSRPVPNDTGTEPALEFDSSTLTNNGDVAPDEPLPPASPLPVIGTEEVLRGF